MDEGLENFLKCAFRAQKVCSKEIFGTKFHVNLLILIKFLWPVPIKTKKKKKNDNHLYKITV
jgi:hypothetical protein